MEFDINKFKAHKSMLWTKRVAPALEALDLICGDRADEYGDAGENFKRIAQRWTERLKTPVSPIDVAVMMIDLKLSRLTHEFKRDSVIDIIGYACLLCELYADEN